MFNYLGVDVHGQRLLQSQGIVHDVPCLTGLLLDSNTWKGSQGSRSIHVSVDTENWKWMNSKKGVHHTFMILFLD